MLEGKPTEEELRAAGLPSPESQRIAIVLGFIGYVLVLLGIVLSYGLLGYVIIRGLLS